MNRNRNRRRSISRALRKKQVNRNYKDSLFRMIFGNRKAALKLYNAINHSNYQNPEEGAVDRAVEECIAEGILADFLKKERGEVKDVILTEYNAERHIKNEKKLSYEAGVEKGIEKGIEKVAKNLLDMGIPINEIILATGLSENEILNIKNNI